MEKHIRKLFNESIIEEAAKRFGIGVDDLKEVGGFENFIYEYKKNNEDYILRFSHSDHRSLQLIEAELDFVHYLAKHEANVSLPIESVHHKLVEKVMCEDGSYFTVTSYVKAKGTPPTKELATDLFFENYGRTIGKFHRLTKDYKPHPNVGMRYTWDEDLLITEARNYLPKEDGEIVEKLEKLVKTIQTFPKNKDNYGLIHTDIHMGNFFIKDHELTVFDFDDCAYQYFVSDIAIALFYFIAYNPNEEAQVKNADYLMTRFMKGYLEEYKLDKESYLKMPYFLKLRELIVYIVLNRSFNLEEVEFAKNYVTRYRERILNDVPFIVLDFLKYYKD